ncbi:ATP-binding protein [Staphylococcus pseudintermedius]|nr:ATP-binding protein [Staphylococcus pseudintermedius]
MKSIQQLAAKIKSKSKIVEQKLNVKCEKCGQSYDYVKFDNGQIVKNGCDCEMKALARKQTANYHKKINRIKVNKVFSKSIINDDLKDATFDNYEPTNKNLEKAKKLCMRYANNFDIDNKQSLMLYGTFGTGKSHLSMSIVKVVKAKGYSVLYMNVPQLITTYKSTFNNSKMTERDLDKIIADVDLLVLDDYGTTLSNFGVSKMFEVMESRTGKHNVITTNNSAKELTTNKDYSKLFSRIMKNTTIVKMNGEDYRLRGVRF